VLLRNPTDSTAGGGGNALDEVGMPTDEEDDSYAGAASFGEQTGAHHVRDQLLASRGADGSFWLEWRDFCLAFQSLTVFRPTPEEMYVVAVTVLFLH
jgi:hypothetical protein